MLADSIMIRNLLLAHVLVILSLAGNMPVVQQELLRIWRTLKTPLFQKRPAKTNHRSGRFWEIDMTKFEP